MPRTTTSLICVRAIISPQAITASYTAQTVPNMAVSKTTIAEVNTDGATGETKYKLQAMQWGMPYEEHMIPVADTI
jgi:hypothetical protein